ncbi:MAG: peroxiredoxin [Pseudomonadota bacterium]|nr:peroxiredoxin [Pseudomonadota bacterium]
MPATDLGEVSAASLKGKPFVLYFYPKDDTSGCTAQACGFRDALPELDKLGLTVIGVSKDGIESHEKFGKKYSLTFPLASDEKTEVAKAFGTWVQKSLYGRTYMGIERSTFLVDGNGVVRAVWRKVDVPGHVEDVKKAVANL